MTSPNQRPKNTRAPGTTAPETRRPIDDGADTGDPPGDGKPRDEKPGDAQTGDAKPRDRGHATGGTAANPFQRIDRPHADVGQSATTKVDWNPTVSTADRGSEVIARSAHDVDPHPESWLTLHATDLIDRLTHWADDLDVREAVLNARIAKQETRERQFRLLQQAAQAEMDEQQRAIDRLRAQIQDQARRLVFQDVPVVTGANLSPVSVTMTGAAR